LGCPSKVKVEVEVEVEENAILTVASALTLFIT